MNCEVCRNESRFNLCEKCFERGYTQCDNCMKYLLSWKIRYTIHRDYNFCRLQCLKEYAKIEQ